MFKNRASDEEVTKYLMWQPHADIEISKSVLRDWINLYPDDKFYQWAIVLKDNGDEPIGGIIGRTYGRRSRNGAYRLLLGQKMVA